MSQVSAQQCANQPGWYEPFLKLITVQECEEDSPSDPDVMEAELVQVVLEIVHIVMWKGNEGSDSIAWKV